MTAVGRNKSAFEWMPKPMYDYGAGEDVCLQALVSSQHHNNQAVQAVIQVAARLNDSATIQSFPDSH